MALYYVAGPMTGYVHYNVYAFRDAQAALEAEGHCAVTPFEANSTVWRKHFGRDFDPFTDKCDYGDPLIAEMFLADLEVLRCADVVAFLPGWEASRGAKVEMLMARMFGKPCVCAVSGRTITLEAAVFLHPPLSTENV